MLKSPGDKAGVREERGHAPGAAKHLDHEPAGDRGRVTPHATPVLFSTRVSSSALLLFGRSELILPDVGRGGNFATPGELVMNFQCALSLSCVCFIGCLQMHLGRACHKEPLLQAANKEKPILFLSPSKFSRLFRTAKPPADHRAAQDSALLRFCAVAMRVATCNGEGYRQP
jgi:hypothetical protein